MIRILRGRVHTPKVGFQPPPAMATGGYWWLLLATGQDLLATG